jgi:hypothetical protein
MKIAEDVMGTRLMKLKQFMGEKNVLSDISALCNQVYK